MSYDKHVGVFSPEGRIYQTEYAVKAVSLAPTALAISCDNFTIFSNEIITSQPLQIIPSQIQQIDNHISALPVGYPADARQIVTFLRNEAQNHWFNFDEPVPLQKLAEELSEKFTEFGRKRHNEQRMGRPFGCGVLLASFDQVIYCDPAGNSIQYKAKAIGSGGSTAQEELEKQFKLNLNLNEGLKMAIQIMKGVIEGDFKNLQVAVLDKNGLKILSREEIKAVADGV